MEAMRPDARRHSLGGGLSIALFLLAAIVPVDAANRVGVRKQKDLRYDKTFVFRQRNAMCTLQHEHTSPWTESHITCEDRRCSKQAFGKMLWQMANKAVASKLVVYPNITMRASENRWTKGLGCGAERTFWDCLYGKPKTYDDCHGYEIVTDTTTLRAAYLYAWLMFTESHHVPLVERVDRGRVENVSMHIRLGDACQKTVRAERPKGGNMWNTGVRHCVDPRRYLSVLNKLFRDGLEKPVVLLATDSDRAVRVIRTGRFVVLTSDDAASRAWYERSTWIENRVDVDDASVMLSVADLRFLALGQFFIFSACGYYARTAYTLASFYRGRFLDAYSVDECSPSAPDVTGTLP